MDVLQNRILTIMRDHAGETNRIGRESLRQELSDWLGREVGDREMRLAIEELRTNDAEGCMIASALRGGYYMAESRDGLDKFLNSEHNRAMSILIRNSIQRKRAGLKPTQIQPRLFDVPARREDEW